MSANKGLSGAASTAWSLLSPPARRKAGLLAVMMLINGLFEVSGIAGILPFMSLAADPSAIQSTPWLLWVYTQLEFTSPNRFLLFLGGSFLGLFLLVNLVRGFTTWLSFRFSFQVSHELATGLLRSYLSRSYLWLRGRNSAELSRDVLHEVEQLVHNIYYPLAESCTNILACAMISLTLLVMDPRVAIAAAVGMFGLFSLVYRVNRNALAQNGQIRDRLNGLRYRAVNEGLYALREARLVSRREQFLTRYSALSRRYNRSLALGEMIYELPKFFTEFLALAVLVGALLYFSLTGKGVGWLGLYVMAIWRMVPALQILYRNLARIRFFTPSLNRLAGELQQALDPVHVDVKPLPLGVGVELRQVEFQYENSTEPTLQAIDLQVRRGERVALVGQTGSGKTTLADILAGLVPPHAGELWVNGQPLRGDQVTAWQTNIGYVPQEIYLSDESVAANIGLGLSIGSLEQEAVERAARAAHVHDFVVNELPQGYKTRLGERGAALSGGQRQRIGIARALFHNPELLILDEATSALDENTQRKVLDSLAELEGLTVLVIAHRLEVVKSCDRIYHLERGRVLGSGSYDELLESCAEFRQLVEG